MKPLILLFFILILISIACGSGTPTPTSTPQEEAWYACISFIEQQLGVSSWDAQRYSPGNVKTIKNDQYKIDVYYAKNSTIYECEILHRPDGDWQLLNLLAGK